MWANPDKVLPLTTNITQIWKTTIENNLDQKTYFLSLLSEHEKHRVSKFRFEKDKHNYIIARGILRCLLGYYIKEKPHEIIFGYGEYNKPFLKNRNEVKFNVSHSGGVIIMGFNLNHDIGVDVEFNKNSIEIKEVSSNFFSKNESSSLLALAVEEQLNGFYNCWTRKEAFIKAKGGGLSIPLDQFEVSLKDSETPKLKSIYWNEADTVNWKLNAFDCGPDFTGAVVVNNSKSVFEYYNWDSSLLNSN